MEGTSTEDVKLDINIACSRTSVGTSKNFQPLHLYVLSADMADMIHFSIRTTATRESINDTVHGHWSLLTQVAKKP
ncbi:hypothetical protein VFPPC_18752 [Pochonia chlamydosporia 170]|uniref:Uncharacterized protein n=1 Tax=Pochonia chlamydosporia 170 TaxID=1380566 RepID=A0A219ARX8_METCM|nr:hypothetical protein VFPPC_18752 [Pochonia chlamydosporia 170]OWT43521.1 hypothetical protein VFPPC_18752 [Pochonia chlamydosporia 170]